MATPLTFEQRKAQAEALPKISEVGSMIKETAGDFATGVSNVFSDIKEAINTPSEETYKQITGLTKETRFVAQGFLKKMEEAGLDVSDPNEVSKFIDFNKEDFDRLPNSLKGSIKMFVNNKQSYRGFLNDLTAIKDSVNNPPKSFLEEDKKTSVNTDPDYYKSKYPSAFDSSKPVKSKPLFPSSITLLEEPASIITGEVENPKIFKSREEAMKAAPEAITTRFDKDLGYVPRAIPAEMNTKSEEDIATDRAAEASSRAKAKVQSEYAGKSSKEVLAHYANKHGLQYGKIEEPYPSDLPDPAKGMNPYSIEAYNAKKQAAMSGTYGTRS